MRINQVENKQNSSDPTTFEADEKVSTERDRLVERLSLICSTKIKRIQKKVI